jgi:hypothetical protein
MRKPIGAAMTPAAMAPVRKPEAKFRKFTWLVPDM